VRSYVYYVNLLCRGLLRMRAPVEILLDVLHAVDKAAVGTLCMCVCVCVICVHTHGHTHARARAHTHTSTDSLTHACTHARTHAHKHTHTHAHTHTHTHQRELVHNILELDELHDVDGAIVRQHIVAGVQIHHHRLPPFSRQVLVASAGAGEEGRTRERGRGREKARA